MDRLLPDPPVLTRWRRRMETVPHGLPTAFMFTVSVAALAVGSLFVAGAALPGHPRPIRPMRRIRRARRTRRPTPARPSSRHPTAVLRWVTERRRRPMSTPRATGGPAIMGTRMNRRRRRRGATTTTRRDDPRGRRGWRATIAMAHGRRPPRDPRITTPPHRHLRRHRRARTANRTTGPRESSGSPRPSSVHRSGGR